MLSVTTFAKLRRAWQSGGEHAFIVAGSLWLAFQLLATFDAHEQLCQFLSRFDHLELDELLLLAALALPAACAMWWRQTRQLRQERLRRMAADALANIILQRQQRDRDFSSR